MTGRQKDTQKINENKSKLFEINKIDKLLARKKWYILQLSEIKTGNSLLMLQTLKNNKGILWIIALQLFQQLRCSEQLPYKKQLQKLIQEKIDNLNDPKFILKTEYVPNSFPKKQTLG